jgi:hypothetical protein
MAMTFEIRKEFQMLLNEIRKEKGIPLSKIEFVSEKGKKYSRSYVSLVCNNKRGMSMGTALQYLEILGVTLMVDSKGIHICDEEFNEHAYISMPTKVFMDDYTQIDLTINSLPTTYTKKKK